MFASATSRALSVPSACTGCSECTQVCPIQVPNKFDENMAPRKAIYRPYPQAVPNIFAIDKRDTSPCKAACRNQRPGLYRPDHGGRYAALN